MRRADRRRSPRHERNASVLTHGVRPLTREDGARICELLDRITPAFWKYALGTPKRPLPQRPRELGEVGQ